jgi:ribose 5-phosphate isomerase B
MIYIASDHAGFQLKKQLIQYLKIKGLEVEDLGPNELDPDDDYPDFIIPCAQKVSQQIAQGKDVRGIVIGGSGQGEAIAANKVKGIRAALFYGGNLEIVKFSREHNDTNILSLGARFLTPDQAKMAVSIWLETGFDRASRHQRRHDKIARVERK